MKKRIFALIGIILLLAMYASTMVFAFMDSPYAESLLMASIFCTIAVPVLLYAIQMVAKHIQDVQRNDRKKLEIAEKEAQRAKESDEDSRGTAAEEETASRQGDTAQENSSQETE